MKDTILEMNNITKCFSNVVANNDVSLVVKRGSIHALIGENGAGKSTLMNVLCGLHQPDSGRIFLNGNEIELNSTLDAIKYGIGMVHQHFMLVPEITVLENIILGVKPPKKLFYTDYEKSRKVICSKMNEFGFEVDLDRKVYDLSVGEMQKVEIIKALHRGAEILILDEPTAVLTPIEAEQLFRALRNFIELEKTVIFISHKLKEVLAISDEITVMRQGIVTGKVKTSQTNETELARMMVGRDVVLRVKKDIANPGEEVLRLDHFAVQNDRKLPAVRDVSFSVRRGEIVGIAGVDGNGQTELVEAIAGMRKQCNGKIFLENIDITAQCCSVRRHKGIAHIPADRMVFGVNSRCSIEENLILTEFNLEPYSKHGFIKTSQVETYVDEQIKRFQIVAASEKTLVGDMSGGNMQKVVVARELSTDPVVLIAAQPTRGVDVGSIEFIHKEIIKLRDKQKGILLISMELDEILALADRILVMYEGQIVGEFANDNIDELDIGLYMTGVKRMEGSNVKEKT